MKNKLSDLNDHLFAQLEKLSEPDLKGDELKTEINRAGAMSELATNIIGAAAVTVSALKLVGNGHISKVDLPKLLTGDK